MTMATRKPRRTPATEDGSVRLLDPSRLNADIDARLKILQRAYEAASGSERDYHLLGALVMCGPFRPLPDWLFKALLELLAAKLPKPDKHWLRAELVRAARERRGLSWEGAYVFASEKAAATPIGGSERTMKASYQIDQRRVRQARRR
jgi:hypothetical protein